MVTVGVVNLGVLAKRSLEVIAILCFCFACSEDG